MALKQKLLLPDALAFVSINNVLLFILVNLMRSMGDPIVNPLSL